ncbi:hypothetical protein K501DRAFT_27736 [Backusella circina FSU 941]|nr:hypothetical protein K501DRAFT_27736 [Backusella circina FSU 941]
MQNLQYQSKNTRTPQRGSHQEPARRTPSMDKIPRIKPSKSNQSLASVGSSGRLSSEYTPKSKLRPPAKVTRSNSNSSQKSSNDKSTVTKRKSLSKLPSLPSATDNELLSCPQRLTRSSSNGSGSAASSGTSTSTSEKRKRMAERKLKEVSAEQENAMEQLQEDLEREKLSVRTLQGQKEAIAKDLDYFCQLVDEVTEEKDQFKKKYEEEKMKNERLQKQLGHTDQREIIGSDMTSQLEFELQAAQQQATESHYNFYSNLQCKNDEISRLKSDLKKAQRQIQVLRNTMEQMLKADGKSFDDDCDTVQTRSSYEDSVTSESDSKHLLLQTGFPEQRHSPPSPTPGVNEDVSGYDFLNNDYGSKKKPESFNKKALVSRMRKDQLEEMLGEVDSQLYRVRQQIRRPS